jgi:hypothetical protein
MIQTRHLQQVHDSTCSAATIVRAAKGDAVSRFVLCCLTFAVLLCLAHGRLSREPALFAWIGVVAGMTQSARTRAPVAHPAKSVVS